MSITKRQGIDKKTALRPVGRPCKYDPSYCEKLIDLMANGALDCECFAYWNVNKSTFYDWINKYPDFREAHEQGLPKCEAWWIDWGKKGMRGEVKGFSFNAWIAFMNNKFKWAKNAMQDQQSTTTNNISINNMNVLQHKSAAELIDVIQGYAQKNSDLIDVKFIDDESNKSEQSE